MNEARRLLTVLRKGDYAHAGGQESVHMMIKKALSLAPEILKGPCLDVGSGFGGSAYDLHQYGFSSIHGVDIDKAAVDYAKNRYPGISFTAMNASKLETLFEQDTFSFIYMLNVLYAIKEQHALLQVLYRVAKKGALLALFDYQRTKPIFDLDDLAGQAMFPLFLPTLKPALEEMGWEIVDSTDLSQEYLIWYKSFLDKLRSKRGELSQEFKEEDISKVEEMFNGIYVGLEKKDLKGILLFCRKY